MTDVLILGGTGWLSRRIAQRWVDRGAAVVCLARGSREAPDGARLVVGDRDDPEAYGEVARHEWDEVVDVSSHPGHVEDAVQALGARAGHWTYVSSFSAYAANDVVGADETAALAEPAVDRDPSDYSRAKSAGEGFVRALGDRAAILRPGLIVGPGDPTDRFGYWPARFALAADQPVLVPEGASLHAQVIDVDDLADFAVESALRRWHGAVNTIGPSRSLADMLAIARAAAGHTGPVVSAPSDWLVEHGVAHWAGPRSLPLWLPDDMPGFATRSGEAYLASGGRVRSLDETLERVLADERDRGLDRSRRAGPTRAEELDLIGQR